jgi:hypothetical protein
VLGEDWGAVLAIRVGQVGAAQDCRAVTCRRPRLDPPIARLGRVGEEEVKVERTDVRLVVDDRLVFSPPLWILTVALLPGAPVGDAATGARSANAPTRTTDSNITSRARIPPFCLRVRAMLPSSSLTCFDVLKQAPSPGQTEPGPSAAVAPASPRGQPPKVLAIPGSPSVVSNLPDRRVTPKLVQPRTVWCRSALDLATRGTCRGFATTPALDTTNGRGGGSAFRAQRLDALPCLRLFR